MQRLNESLDNIKQRTIEALGKENLLEKATTTIQNSTNLEEINEKATEVREGILDTIQKIFTK